jgi:hypothetical protein
MKIIEWILAGILGIWLIVEILPGPIQSITSESYSEPFSVTTAANVTNATETLSYGSYYEDLTGISATSDNSGDDPVVLSYNPDTKATLVAGLEPETSRILTIAYTREAQQTSIFYGTIPIMRMVPLILLLILVFIIVWSAFKRHMGG